MDFIGIVLLIAGFLFVGIEMTIPGFGAPGFIGLGCFTGAVFVLADTAEQGIMLTIAIIVLCAIILTVVMGLLKSRKIKSPIILEEEVKTPEGFLDSRDLEYLVGKEGVAFTDLKPSGKCRFDGIQFDVRSDGGYVKKGTPVRISYIHENTIMVEVIE